MERDRKDDGGLVSGEEEEGRRVCVVGVGGVPGMKCDKGWIQTYNVACKWYVQGTVAH